MIFEITPTSSKSKFLQLGVRYNNCAQLVLAQKSDLNFTNYAYNQNVRYRFVDST